MCGRYALNITPNQLAQQFQLDEQPEGIKRFNIAPTQPVPVVRVNDTGHRGLAKLHWGLIPSWAKDPAMGNRMINARSETVTSKPSFRTAFKRRRCLFPASGFYEWQKVERPTRKQPTFIRMASDEPFGLAGLWERWQHANGSELESCTILTTHANALMKPIHDRMPVIIQPAEYQKWLDRDLQDHEALSALLRPYAADAMATHAVSAAVNDPRHEGPDCVQPLPAPRSLF